MGTIMGPPLVLPREVLKTTQAAPGMLPIITDDRTDMCPANNSMPLCK